MKKAHTKPAMSREAGHGSALPGFVKSVVFGGNDGALVAATLLAASSGCALSAPVIRCIGVACVGGMSVASGLSDYNSSKAEAEHKAFERRREAWELKNFPEGEREEMIELYVNKGMKENDAETIIGTMTKYPSFFLDHSACAGPLAPRRSSPAAAAFFDLPYPQLTRRSSRWRALGDFARSDG